MCMGFGCNACGVIGARIIDSPRDKLIAILTNNFIPCNGRFPLLISIISMFFIGSVGTLAGGIKAAAILVLLILFSVGISLGVSYILSVTFLKGIPSHFTLELPSYRRPKVLSVVCRSIMDKAIFVLFRAIKTAIPAGLIIWFFANINIGSSSILSIVAGYLNPIAKLIGMDGYILLAFFLAFPANEIVLPIILMSYLATGNMIDIQNLGELKNILVNNGWTIMTALSVCLFSIMHFPCATTILTIKKEVGTKWAIVAFILPLLVGVVLLFILNLLF